MQHNQNKQIQQKNATIAICIYSGLVDQ